MVYVTGTQGGSGLHTGGIRQTGSAMSLSPHLSQGRCQTEMLPGGIRQTKLAISLSPHPSQGYCQTDRPLSRASWLRLNLCSATGTTDAPRPRARLDGSASTHLQRLWGYRGCRVGEASNPGPKSPEPDRVVTIHRVPMGEEAPGLAPSDCPRRVESGFGLSTQIPP